MEDLIQASKNEQVNHATMWFYRLEFLYSDEGKSLEAANTYVTHKLVIVLGVVSDRPAPMHPHSIYPWFPIPLSSPILSAF